MKKQDIISWAQGRIKTAEASLAEFAAELVKDPEQAVYWSSRIFGDAGNLYGWKLVLTMAEADCTLDVIVESLKDSLVGGAARPSYTSNFAANHLAQEKVRAIAEAHRELERRLKILRKVAEGQPAPAPAAS